MFWGLRFAVEVRGCFVFQVQGLGFGFWKIFCLSLGEGTVDRGVHSEQYHWCFAAACLRFRMKILMHSERWWDVSQDGFKIAVFDWMIQSRQTTMEADNRLSSVNLFFFLSPFLLLSSTHSFPVTSLLHFKRRIRQLITFFQSFSGTASS